MYVYRKSDLLKVAGIQDISQLESVYDACLKHNYGGKLTDYGTMEVNYNKFHLERNESGEAIAIEDVSSIEEQRQIVLTQLKELDLTVPQIVEDLIEYVNFKPHKTKEDIITRKKELRKQLQALGGVTSYG